MIHWHFVEYHDYRKKSEFLQLDSSKGEREFYPPGWSQISCGHATIEEVKAKHGIPDEPCRVCGNLFNTDYVDEVKNILVAQNICFGCNFWNEMVAKQNRQCLHINGMHYTIVPNDDSPGAMRGHGGRKFRIRYLDNGEIVETNNLWCQGNIPPHFQDKLPDNAEYAHE